MVRAELAAAQFLLDHPGFMKHTLLATALSIGVAFTAGCGARSAGLDPEAAAGSSGTTSATTTGVSVGPSSASGSGSASGPGSSGSGGGQVCPGFGDECTGCLSGACPSTYCTCYENDECLALYTCLSDCGNNDLICQKGCYAAHGGAVAKLQAVLDCSVTKCPGPCGQ